MKQEHQKFQESIGKEMSAVKDRVRNLIGDANWGEDGRYKEILLMNMIGKHLPARYSVGTGFVVRSNGELTTQMDIILFEDTYPVLFREGPFVVLPAQGVRGIIEVKSTSSREIIQEGIIKGSKNGQIIMSDRVDIDFDLFNGLFCFDSHSENLETLFEPVHNQLKEFAKANISPMFRKDAFIRSCVNCLSFGSDHIIGLVDGDAVGYTFPGLAPAYFISILMKFLQERGNDALRGYLQAIPTKALRGNIFD